MEFLHHQHKAVEILGYLASALIGLSLGLVGSGGSILTVPILVYLFGMNASLATSYSLLIVGSTALIGTLRHHSLGNLRIQTAIVFATPSVVTSLLVRHFLLPRIPEQISRWGGFVLTKDSLLLLMLAILMVWTSSSMIRHNSRGIDHAAPGTMKLVVTGLAVGIVTGLLGAGGGFLIIPALIFFAGLPMKQAVGTSLLIIFLNATLTFIGDLQLGVKLNATLLATLSLIAFGGMILGTQLSRRISGAFLKPVFGWFVLIMGIYIITKELFLS